MKVNIILYHRRYGGISIPYINPSIIDKIDKQPGRFIRIVLPGEKTPRTIALSNYTSRVVFSEKYLQISYNQQFVYGDYIGNSTRTHQSKPGVYKIIQVLQHLIKECKYKGRNFTGILDNQKINNLVLKQYIVL